MWPKNSLHSAPRLTHITSKCGTEDPWHLLGIRKLLPDLCNKNFVALVRHVRNVTCSVTRAGQKMPKHANLVVRHGLCQCSVEVANSKPGQTLALPTALYLLPVLRVCQLLLMAMTAFKKVGKLCCLIRELVRPHRHVEVVLICQCLRDSSNCD